MVLDDFKVGDRFVSREHLVTEAEILDFGRRFDPQYFHTDPAAAAASPFGGLIASGFHMLALSFRLFFDLGILTGNMASPGLDQVRWLKTLRPGDRIRQVAEVLSVAPSKSKPTHGRLRMRHATLNQHDEIVMTVECEHFIETRSRG